MMDGGAARLARTGVNDNVEVVVGGNRSVEDFAVINHELIYFVEYQYASPWVWVCGAALARASTAWLLFGSFSSSYSVCS